jgi:hypothetical protein
MEHHIHIPITLKEMLLASNKLKNRTSKSDILIYKEVSKNKVTLDLMLNTTI